jgi:hypothetical protein
MMSKAVPHVAKETAGTDTAFVDLDAATDDEILLVGPTSVNR